MAKEATARYVIKVIGVRGEEFEDVVFCSHIRAPFIKKASYWYIKINVSALWAQQLFNDLSVQVKPDVFLQIKEIKHEGDFDSLSEASSTMIHSKKYKCITATSDNMSTNAMSDQNLIVNLILVDHIFYDMSISNMFNRKLSDVTAFEALQEYEKSLKKHYGDQTFYNNYVGVDEDKTDYKYEQMLIVAENDLQVSDLLLYSKKVLKNLSFYFFDDFYLDSKNKNHIAIHFINLGDITKFKQFDIAKHFDTLYSNMIISEIPLADTFRKLTNGSDSFIIKTKYMFDNQTPESVASLFKPKITDITSSDFSVNSERESVCNTPTIQYEKSDVRKKSMQIFAPDKKDLAKERLQNYHEFIDSKVRCLKILQTTDCFVDWLQFGRSYNLDLTQKDKFLFTPIMIVNIFYKDGSERATKHVAKSLMLEYSSFDKTCSSCKFFGDRSCTLHSITKTENNYCFDHTETK